MFQDLLLDASYDVERAANNYFEGNFRKRILNKSNSTPTVTSLSAPVTTQKHITSLDYSWLIGRRVVLGYTLTGGHALRSLGLHFKYEGVLNGCKAPAKTTKRAQKFGGANLLFECYPRENDTKNVRLAF